MQYSKALSAQNAALNDVNEKTNAYNDAHNNWMNGKIDCTQPGNANSADCVDGSRVRGLFATLLLNNATLAKSEMGKSNAVAAVSKANAQVSKANEGLSTVSTEKTQKLASLDKRTRQLESTRASKYSALQKVQKTCSPSMVGEAADTGRSLRL